MDLWVFDNDGTLYDYQASALGSHLRAHMVTYIADRTGLLEATILAQIPDLKQKWQTEFSVVAFQREYDLDFTDFVASTYLLLDFVACGIPTPDAIRDAALTSIREPKVILTANPSGFARRMVEHLELAHHFQAVYGMEETGFIPKQNSAVYAWLQQQHPEASRFILVDDLVANLDAARTQGWQTIHFAPPSHNPGPASDHTTIASFKELHQLSL